MEFSIFRGVCTALFCLLLLALFWFPSQFLETLHQDLTTSVDEAIVLLEQNDPQAPQQCAAIRRHYEDNMLRLERFLNHADVDNVADQFAQADASAQSGDYSDAAAALQEAISQMEHLVSIERFRLNSLL